MMGPALTKFLNLEAELWMGYWSYRSLQLSKELPPRINETVYVVLFVGVYDNWVSDVRPVSYGLLR